MAALVSIITPCYNGERYLDRYFNSILSQTYPAIELIFVNDGSSDRTEEMALQYGERLKEKGYQFTYVYQENAGQSAAINQGLKVFKGKYLNWTDADNYLPDDSVEKRVEVLEANPNLGLVIGRSIAVDDQEYKQVGIISETGFDRTSTKDLIEDFLKGQISCTCCCSTMVRSSMFLDSMPDPPQIEAPREIGQNYQLFIPIMFRHETKYVPDVLGYYVVHKDSHSRARKSFEQKIHIQDVAKDTLYSIADRMKINEPEVKWFKGKIEEYDCKNRLNILQHYRRKDGLSVILARLKESGRFDAEAKKMALKIKYPVIKELGDLIWRFRNK